MIASRFVILRGFMMCKRCSDCRGMSHHWMPNYYFDDEDFEDNSTTHCCKHCDAVGNECHECCGEGEVDSGGTDERGSFLSLPCLECNGEGVIWLAGGKDQP